MNVKELEALLDSRIAKALEKVAPPAAPAAGTAAPAAPEQTTHYQERLATPAAPTEPSVRVEEPAMPKGVAAARCLRALGASMLSTKSGRPRSAAEFAKEWWGEAHPVTKALGVSGFAAGGALLPLTFSGELIELLRPAAVFDQLKPAEVDIVDGKIVLPKLAGGASAHWLGEGQVIKTTAPLFGQVERPAHKVAALVPMNNEWFRSETIKAAGYDQIVLQDVIAALAQTRDIALVRSDGTNAEPRGLRYWLPAGSANLIPANATVNLANVTKDLGKARLALKKGNSRMIRPGWIMGPSAEEFLMTLRDGNGNYVFKDEMEEATLRRMPYRVTNQMPETLGAGNESELYLADFADVVVGIDRQLLVDMSVEASYSDGVNVVSAFQQDQAVLRVIMYTTMLIRHAESLAVLTGLTWAP